MALNLDTLHTETDSISAMELQSNRRMLYFSDGVMEEPSSSSDSETEADVPDKSLAVHLDEHEMALGPRLRYKASKVGHKFLAGIDYVGGGLASFLGITNSKYASELEHYKRTQEQEQDNNWQPRHNNNNPNETLILCAPTPGEGHQMPMPAPPPPTRQ